MNEYLTKYCHSETFRKDPSKYWKITKPYITDKIKTTDQNIFCFMETWLLINPQRFVIFSMNTSLKWLQLLEMKTLSVWVKALMISCHAIKMMIPSFVSPLSENYRLLNILPSISKVFEKVFNQQLYEYSTYILSDFMDAYREKYGCQHVLTKVIENSKRALDNHMHVGLLLLDLSKAFGCLPHRLL